MLSNTQQEQYKIQRQSEAQRQERSELLARVYKDISRFLGSEVGDVREGSADRQDASAPANFNVLRDTLLSRLRAMLAVRSDFEKRIRETENSIDQRMG